MPRELRGRIKERIWLRPTCEPDGETLKSGRLARKAYLKDARKEDGPRDIVAPDVFTQAFDLDAYDPEEAYESVPE